MKWANWIQYLSFFVFQVMISVPSRWIFFMHFYIEFKLSGEVGQNFVSCKPGGFLLNLFFICVYAIPHNFLLYWNLKSFDDILFRKSFVHLLFFISSFHQHRISASDRLKLFGSNLFVIINFFNSDCVLNLWHHLTFVKFFE